MNDLCETSFAKKMQHTHISFLSTLRLLDVPGVFFSLPSVFTGVAYGRTSSVIFGCHRTSDSCARCEFYGLILPKKILAPMSILSDDDQCECERLTIEFRSPIPKPRPSPTRGTRYAMFFWRPQLRGTGAEVASHNGDRGSILIRNTFFTGSRVDTSRRL